MTPKAKALACLQTFITSGQIVELRAVGVSTKSYRKPHTVSGFYDTGHLADMAEEAARLTRLAKAVYFTLNPLRSNLLARRANRTDVAAAGECAKDTDVLCRRWLLVDIDPKRDKLISATDAEKEHARRTAVAICEFLTARGWPAPVRGDSGNGYHLVYRIDLPADDNSLLRRCLLALAVRFDTPQVEIDRTVYNPSRVCKLAGTWARKGDHIDGARFAANAALESRPHRQASLLEVPAELSPVPVALVEVLASEAPQSRQQKASPRRRPGAGRGGNVQVRVPKQREEIIQRARAYLATIDPAIEGQGDSKPTFRAACVLVEGFGLTIDEARPLLQEYSARCVLPWSDQELEHKLEDADQKATDRGYLLRRERNGRPAADHCESGECQSTESEVNGPENGSPDAGGAMTGGPPAEGDEDPEKPPTVNLTDRGNALRMVRAFGTDLRYEHLWKKWLVWDGSRWSVDNSAAATAMAKRVIADLFHQAAAELRALAKEKRAAADDDSEEADETKKRVAAATRLLQWALTSESAPRINGMLDLARSENNIPISYAVFDRDPLLLNCANGTLDLRTGLLREHRREEYLTKLCPTPYDAHARCPLFEQVLRAILAGDEELLVFIQRLLGRCLTGDVSEHLLPIFWGCGANGKSTLVNILLEVLGRDYAMKANADLLMQANGERHPTELAQLFGMRLVVASETHEGRRLNEALIKDLTGGEPIRARRMREDFWEYKPTHKVILLTNHKPQVRGTDTGMWRRLRLVPFTVTFWDPDDPATGARSDLDPQLRQDKQLGSKLLGEAPGILAWLVQGCLDWQRHGLPLPEKVRVATEEYRVSEDLLRQFIADCCVTGPAYRIKRCLLYAAYAKWCQGQGEQELTSRVFGEQMTERGFERYTSNGVWYRGIALPNSGYTAGVDGEG